MISNTCVAPPVGNGNAGTPRSNTNSSAKLFSSKRAMRLPRVFLLSLANQRSSSSLTFPGPGLDDDPRGAPEEAAVLIADGEPEALGCKPDVLGCEDRGMFK